MASPAYPSFERIQEIRKQLRDAEIAHWLHHDIYSLNFWVLIAVAVVPWVIWFRFVDRSRLYEVMTLGLLIGFLSTILDSFGTNLLLWGYKDQVVAISPPLFPADISIMAVPFMLIYQRYRTWKTYFFATVVISAFYAFVGEQVFEWLDIYEMNVWKHMYSFPIYVLLALFCRSVLLWLKQMHKET